MDTNTQAALDAAADAAMSEYQTDESRERALRLKNVLTDGVCRIVDVQDQLHPPCVGLIYTDLGEKFPVFDVFTREQAKTLTRKRVKLTIQMSAKGTRYVTGMMAMPPDASTELWLCPRCGNEAKRYSGVVADDFGLPKEPREIRQFYACTSCAYQMEVGP